MLKESEKNFDVARIKKIREELNKSKERFSKSKIREIRRNRYEIENKKNLPPQKIKEIERDIFELQESLYQLKNYYGYDDIEYKGIRAAGNLFGLSIHEDYYNQ